MILLDIWRNCYKQIDLTRYVEKIFSYPKEDRKKILGVAKVGLQLFIINNTIINK